MATGIVIVLIGMFVAGHVIYGDWSTRVVEAVA